VIDDHIAELQNALGAGFQIHRGCDFHFSPQNIQAA